MKRWIVLLWLFWIAGFGAVAAYTVVLPKLGSGAATVGARVETAEPVDDRLGRRVEAAWRNWAGTHGIAATAMAFGEQGVVVTAADHNGYGAKPQPVASLSKVVTGLCLDQVLSEGPYDWQTKLGAIKDQMSVARTTPPVQSHGMTLAQLVTHTSGLYPDLTQGRMAGRMHGSLGLHRRIAFKALGKEGSNGPRGTYFYSNTNYAVLATVIEALTGDTYGDACQARIMQPSGVENAIVEGRKGSMSGSAGWEFTPTDYARFLLHWFAPDSVYMDTPERFPGADSGNGMYRLGFQEWDGWKGRVAAHRGLFTHHDPHERAGSLFLATDDGRVFMAHWNMDLAQHVYDDLQDRVLGLIR
jgi:CubicO group peptidase (beta-lactamase class C family)